VILKLNRLTKIFNYFVSSLIIISSTIVFFQVSLPLFDLNITEVDKKKVIGMKTLNFANASDEKINGTIVFELADNPCKFEESLKVVTETETQKISVIPNISTKISLPLEINPRSSQSVEIVFENMEKCLVKNGDPRDFGAKLINWKYE
jgi:hypothetical protein